ncbi:MAG: aminotransferase class I/II-fold pyridoxal phosphate-dependent enzyme [Acidimicrobiia bacterium]|nr:aminotransferase class I/II-fold pyridoxal phosphate-dependent enzyme [Acidimicrobiia bacterium]
MHTNPVLTSLGTYPLEIVQHRARDRRDAGLPLIDFSIGDPREPTPAFIPATLKDHVPVVSQYPTAKGLPVIREAVAGYLKRRFGVTVDPDTQVIPTSGSKEAIFLTPLAFVERGAGDGVIYGTPGYPVYERGALFAGARVDPVVLSGDFIMRSSDISDEAMAGAALVWMCSPHNPAGSVTPVDEMERILERTRQAGAWLCSDECYVDLYDDEPPGSVLQVAGEGFRGALSYLSLSKRSGMTGYRSGAIVGDAEAIAAIRALRSTVGVAPAEFVQHAGAAAWSDDEHASERRDTFRKKRAILRSAFVEMGHEVVGSDAGLYLWVRVDDDEAATLALLEHGIVVAPGRAFGPGGEGYLRLALVPTVAKCEESAEMIRKVLSVPAN